MGSGCVGSVQIYGQTYYFSDKTQYDEVIALQGDAAAQKTLVDNYQCQYGTRVVSTNEDDLTELADGTNGSGTEKTGMGSQVDEIDYNNWLVNNGLSGISKLSAESKLEDIKAYYEQIANKLNSIMSSVDSALASKDPDTIDSCMTELTYNMTALDSVAKQSGFGSMIPEEYQAYLGIGAFCTATAASTVAAGTLLTVAGVSVSVPVVGWVVAGVCAVAAAGIGIYNAVKQGEIDDLKEQMQQTMDDCTTKFEYAKKEISETVEDIASTTENELKKLEDANFSDIKDMNDMFANINGILIYQATIEKWAGICEKYGVPFKGQNLLDKLGSGDEKEKYANEYVEKFVEHTKNAIETSGNVVDDTGTYIASADDINNLISMLYENEMTRNIDVTKLKDLIEFIKEKNQEDVNNNTETIGDGMYSGGDGSYDFSGYSDAYNNAGENQTGVDGAASNGQYDVDTAQYTDVQDEAKENAQKDVDEYLNNIDPKGKSVEELEELYGTTKADLENFSQYKDNLELDLSKFDTVLADIRAEQQARVDEYIATVSVSGKSMSELEELYNQVSAQGEAFRQASSEVDVSAFEDVLANIRTEQQTIVDNYSTEVSSKIQSAGSVSELAAISAEATQYKDTVSQYSVNTGNLDSINTQVKDKIQTIVDEKTVNYEMQAAMVQTSADALTLANAVNTEIAQLQNPEINVSNLQMLATNLIVKANELKIEEAKKKAEEDAMNVPAVIPVTPSETKNPDSQTGTPLENSDNGGNTNNLENSDGAATPVVIPSFGDGDDAANNSNTESGVGEIPLASDVEIPSASSSDISPSGGSEVPTESIGEVSSEISGETPSEGSEQISNPEGSDSQTEAPSENSDSEENVTSSEGEQSEPTESEPAENAPIENEAPPPSTTKEPVVSSEAHSDSDVISIGQADETTPSANTEDVEQTVEQALEEGKTPEEIADEIEIEIQEN